jgi:hypothetical protein
MNTAELEKRLLNLEKIVAQLQEQAKRENPWPSIIGHFANDAIFDEIIRLGRDYRESQRPDRKKKKSPRKS